MPRLTISSPDGKYGVFELTQPVTTIGRGTANDLVLDDRRVSRFHAVIEQHNDGTCHIADRASSNGVLVNSQRIADSTAIASGDRIAIGGFELTFEEANDAALRIAHADMPPALDRLLQAEGNAGDSGSHKRNGTDASITARLRKLERENYLLSVLYDAGKALHSKLSTDDISAQVLELAFRVEGVERGFMMLFDSDGHVERQTEVRYRRGVPAQQKSAEPQLILSRAVLDRLREERAPILVTDLSGDERFSGSESMKVSGLRSAMCAPLLIDNKVAGLLYVDNLRTTAAFTREELNILAVVAMQAAAAIDNARTHRQLAKQAVERSALERFLAPEVVEMIAANPAEIRLGGTNQKVTILFADIRNFTQLSERMAPEAIVELLNEYFTRASEVIFEHRGTLDKYLGDGLMALFGAPISKGNDAANAVLAALALEDMVANMARESAARGWPAVGVGIGVNTGIVTAGNIGSPRRLDYTVIGDAVNVASRLCASADAGQVLISESTAEELESGFNLEPLEPLQVKGRRMPLSVLRVKN